MKKRYGFTLIEVLVVITIGFMVILLVYQTMQTTIQLSKDIREKLSQMQRTNFFLTSFSARFLCMIPGSKENSFSHDSISIEIVEYKMRKIITYFIEQNDNGKYDLSVREKDVFYDTEVLYTAIQNLDAAEFSFFDGESWLTIWEKDTPPQGISISFEKDNSKIFLPVMIDIQSEVTP